MKPTGVVVLHLLLVTGAQAIASTLGTALIRYGHRLLPDANAAFVHVVRRGLQDAGTPDLLMLKALCDSPIGRQQLSISMAGMATVVPLPDSTPGEITDCFCAMDLSDPVIGELVAWVALPKEDPNEPPPFDLVKRFVPVLMGQENACHSKCQHVVRAVLTHFMGQPGMRAMFVQSVSTSLAKDSQIKAADASALGVQMWDAFEAHAGDLVRCICDPTIDWAHLISATSTYQEVAAAVMQMESDPRPDAVSAQTRAIVRMDMHAAVDVMRALFSAKGICHPNGFCRTWAGDCLCKDGFDVDAVAVFYDSEGVLEYIDAVVEHGADPTAPAPTKPQLEAMLEAVKQVNEPMCKSASCEAWVQWSEGLVDEMGGGWAEEMGPLKAQTCSQMFAGMNFTHTLAGDGDGQPSGVVPTLLVLLLLALIGSVLGLLHRRGKLAGLLSLVTPKTRPIIQLHSTDTHGAVSSQQREMEREMERSQQQPREVV